MDAYVHGYAEEESQRLYDQSKMLRDLFHRNVHYPAGSRVLEAGCGVGAQTAALVKNSPDALITSVDISLESLHLARTAAGSGVNFLQADIYSLPFPAETFDHIFVCFVLEHLSDPLGALRKLKTLLKSEGTFTLIEGDHGSAFFHPDSAEARRVWNCLVDAQARLGGDSFIGRRLYPLLHEAQFQEIAVEPQFIYADAGRPEWVEWFTVKTITAMVKGVKELSQQMGFINEEDWERGIQALLRTAAHPDGVFCYTFFKATARKRRP